MLYSGEQILSFKSCLVFYAGDFKSSYTGGLDLGRSGILGNAVTSQHGALLSDDIKALKTNR